MGKSQSLLIPGKKILVTGASGQLGMEIRDAASTYYPEAECVFLTKNECDITAKEEVKSVFTHHKPDYIINAAAYTAVDRAESEVDQAFAINAYALNNIIRYAGKAKLVHISTDYVYHSDESTPLIEEMIPNPTGVYAQSKWLGEKYIRQSNIPALIIRTSWLYSTHGHNFVKTILKKSMAEENMRIVNDQYGAPTYAHDLAKVLLQIIDMDLKDLISAHKWNNTYNFANEGQTTWYGIAKHILSICEGNLEIEPIPSALYPTPATRPHWSVMDLNKIKKSFGLVIPDWKESLSRALSLMVN